MMADPSAYFLPESANADDFSSWCPLVPPHARTICTNLFGDAFLVDANGVVHMLERGAASVQMIASSEDEFRRKIIDDGEGWQLRPLADRCRSVGKILGEGQCYAYTVLPVLGGDYIEENVWVAPWREWFGLTADIYGQIKDQPDGTPVRLTVGSDPKDLPSRSGFLRNIFRK